MKPLILLFLLTFTISSHAVDSRQLSDPKQQESYETLTKELRCLVCQNQTIADSNAELASDLRRQVYEMLQQGKSEQEIIRFMTDRYGDFVLYKPPFAGKTSLLWIAPGLFLFMGLTTVFFVIRRKKASAKAQVDNLDISSEKQKKIRSLLEKGELS
ncbi:MAG: cytochrome c-type biogenesis protein [Methylococcales bacterium]